MQAPSQLPPVATSSLDAQLGLPEIPVSHPDLPGLAVIRTEKSLTPEFVAAALRLRAAQIMALEQQAWAHLPGPAYIKGFLRSYCKFLGVPADPYIAQYVLTLQTQAPRAGESLPSPVAQAVPPQIVSAVLGDPQLPLAHFDDGSELNKQYKRTAFIAIVLVTATLVFLAVWERALWVTLLQAKMAQWWPAESAATRVQAAPASATPLVLTQPAGASNGDAPSLTLSPPNSPAAEPATPTPVVATNNASAYVAAPPSTSAGEVLRVDAAKSGVFRTLDVQFVESVWLEVRDKTGAPVMTGMHKAGTSAKIKADAPLLLIVGAAHAVTVKVDGKQLDLEPHTAGNVSKVKIP